ncbi:protein YgfX [Pseudomonas sp. LRF_L74]|uniref:protein YgfX n=1 Tax=Pseudomonas sp. LRF_L74 TaxID=3369422 RepID=UPI003F60C93C
MSSQNKRFECHWQPSRRLLAGYVVVQALAGLAIGLLDIPLALKGLLLLLCAAQACWVVPRHLVLNHTASVTGLRVDEEGWSLMVAGEWVAVELRPDSLALPQLIVLRYRRPGHILAGSVCLPGDSLSADIHRQLRVRLRFSRNRWAVAG